MPNKSNSNQQLSPRELAKHLRKPEGEVGKMIGLQMNIGNQYISLNTYQLLDPKADDCILEIGMGNGFYIKDLLALKKRLTYTGVDFSPTMIQEATNLNQEFTRSGQVKFKEASIENLPFEENSFDGICSANTLYFWPDAADNVMELNRVLKPSAKVVLAYRDKSCMDQLEMTKYGFKKYNPSEVEELLHTAGFKNISTQMINEPDLDFGEKILPMQGFYSIGFK